MHPASLRHSQNFLHRARLVAHLLDLTSLQAADTVYEIGPGTGQITAQLARSCQRVIAVEKDPRLYALLQRKFAAHTQVDIRQGDFLAFPLPHTRYKVFSNIPFDQTAAILQKLSAPATAPQAAYLILQKEAAWRFIGEPKETLRSVLLKPWFDLHILYTFQRTDFHPRPDVDAVLLGMQQRQQALVREPERGLFRDFVVYAFTARQPDLQSTLKGIFTYPQMRYLRRTVPAGALPSQFALTQWLDLFHRFQELAPEQNKVRIRGSEQRLKQQQTKLEKIHQTRR